jgi:hypothetical protein
MAGLGRLLMVIELWSSGSFSISLTTLDLVLPPVHSRIL